jgi:hypothetical protein
VDEDIEGMTREQLIAEVRRLRAVDPGAPRQHRTRALLAPPGALGPPAREDRPGADRSYVARVSPRLCAVPTVSRRTTA